jgi:hypothetical protein
MALARIITRSDAYSRELTLDLLARGYAVEIVSPDKIPDNIADLELRVDAGPGDQLIASVVIRRSPEPREATRIPEEPVSFHAEPAIEDVELPAALPQLAPQTFSVAAETLHEPEFDAEEGARRISPLDTFPSWPVEPPIPSAEENSTIEQVAMRPTIVRPTMVGPTMVPPTREPQPFHRPAGWFWRAGLTFASVMLLALVLGFGMRRSGKAPAQNSGAVSAEKNAAASPDVNLLSAADPEKDTEKDPGKDPGQVASTAAPPSAMKSEANSSQPPKESLPAKAGATTARAATSTAGAKSSRRYGDDLIARDTVTYLDKHAAENAAARAKLAKDSARRHPSSHERR